MPLTREQRFGSLRRIDHRELETPGGGAVGRRAWANVVDLLEQIELCSFRGGCHAYASTLASRMAGGVGVSESTLHRTRRLAASLGLLETRACYTSDRQTSNHWIVQWTRVRLLSGAEEPAPETDTPPCLTDTPPCQTDTPIKGLASTSTPASVSGRQPSSRPEKQPSEAPSRIPAPPRDHAFRVLCKLKGPGKATPRDQAAAWKWCACSHLFGEQWLANVTEAVERVGPANRFAYAWSVAREGPGEAELYRAMARAPEPPGDWPWQEAKLRERACVAEGVGL